MQGVKVLSISKSQIAKTKICAPRFESEQAKIASFLSLLDSRIAAQRKLVELLKKHKRGLLREVFEENIDGKSCPFSEIACRRNEKISPTKNSNLDCIELEHIEPETGMCLGTVPLRIQNSLKNLCKPNDIIFGKLRPYLRKFLFSEAEYAVSSETWILTASDGIYPKFLFYLIQSEPFMRAANVSSGTKMPRSEWSNVANAKFYIPNIKKQKSISDCFSLIDVHLQQNQKSLSAMEVFKRGLLQQMFI
jgi:type I restriction enzyme S subunit